MSTSIAIPDNASGRQNLAMYLAAVGETDAALAQLEAVDRLDPDRDTHAQRAAILRVAGRYDEAIAEEEALIDSNDPALFGQGYRARAQRLLQTGRLAEARATIREALGRLQGHQVRGERRLDRLKVQQTTREALRSLAQRLAQARAVRGEALSFFIDLESTEREGARVLTLADELAEGDSSFAAQQRVHAGRMIGHSLEGDERAARESAEALLALFEGTPLPERVRRRLEHQADGSMAWARGDWEEAAEELAVALELLARRTQDQRVAIGYLLGEALWRLGRHEEAASAFAEVVEAPFSLYQLPVLHIRALYYEGRAAEMRGDAATARDRLGRFLELWGEGDIDPAMVEDARARLGAAG